MRTRWSVSALCALASLAGCRGAPLKATVWEQPQKASLLAASDPVDRPPPQRPALLTVQQAVAEALTANRSVQQVRLAAAIALATEKEARSGLLPALVASGGYRARDKPPVANSPDLGASFQTGPKSLLSYRIGLDFPIFAFGKYSHNYKAAQFARMGAEADRSAAEADIAAAVTAAALDLLTTVRAVAVAKSNEEALARQVEDSQSLLDAGRVTKSAVLEAQVIHDRAQRDHAKLISLIPIKRLIVNQLLGRPPTMTTDIEDAPVDSAPTFSLKQLLAEAQHARPELQAARMRVEAAIAGHKSERGAGLPELRGSLAYQGSDSDFASPSEWGTFGLTLDIPLYLGGASAARIRRAAREIEVARLALADLEQLIHTEVVEAHRAVAEAYLDIGVAQRSIARSEENLRIQREKFNNGRATSQEVLQSNSLLTQSSFDAISALYSYNNALSELHRVRGADPRKEPETDGTPPPKTKKETE